MTDVTLVRRLTTILALDVVAFSTMSARDEEHALALLGTRMDVAGRLVRQHRGRVFKLTGDGLLAELASPVEAVRAALEIQEAMRSINATAGPDAQLNLRIGLNLGDVVESGDDLLGDAVNVAVRLESIAPHGGVCVSSSVYEQIVGKLMLGAEDLGEQHVKNIPRPIHAYRLTLDGHRPDAPAPLPHPAHEATKAGPRSRLVLVAGVVIALLTAAGAGTLALREYSPAASPQVAEPTSAPTDTLPPTPATPPPIRPFNAKQVPFVPDFHWRALENYAGADGSKALAINVRGIFAIAARRIDDATAKRVALDDCNRFVQRDVPLIRDFDRCMIYAVGNDVVWSFRSPPTPPPPYVPSLRPVPPIPFDTDTAPLLHANARKRLAQHYVTATHPRALVFGRNNFDWWTPSETDADAIRRNLQICGHLTGRPCLAYALDNNVLVRTPQSMRVVDVFVPQDVGGLDAAQRQALDRYLIDNDWRAVALSRNGRPGIASGKSSEAEAVASALQACTEAGGTGCAIAAIGPFSVARD